MLSYGSHFIDNQDRAEVLKSLKNNTFITTGQYLKKFENSVNKKLKCKFSICCNSGTSAIYLALSAIGLSKGDNVIIPSINFIAAANTCSLMGANIFFSDVDPVTQQTSDQMLISCIKRNKLKKIKVVFTMHLGGAAIYQKKIFRLKRKYNFKIIEDACHALGGIYENSKPVGSSIYSDLTVFSLHPVKSITAGEGGLITTNNKDYAKHIEIMRSHGITSRKNYSYDIKESSLNFRISELNCALGFSQFKKLSKFIKKRRQLVKRYNHNLKKYNRYVEIVNIKYINHSAWHLLILKFNFEKLKLNYDQLYKILKAKKIYTQLHYKPSYKFSKFKNKKINLKNYINSENYNRSCMSFPLFYNLKNNQVDKICKAIQNLLYKKLKIV